MTNALSSIRAAIHDLNTGDCSYDDFNNRVHAALIRATDNSDPTLNDARAILRTHIGADLMRHAITTVGPEQAFSLLIEPYLDDSSLAAGELIAEALLCRDFLPHHRDMMREYLCRQLHLCGPMRSSRIPVRRSFNFDDESIDRVA